SVNRERVPGLRRLGCIPGAFHNFRVLERRSSLTEIGPPPQLPALQRWLCSPVFEFMQISGGGQPPGPQTARTAQLCYTPLLMPLAPGTRLGPYEIVAPIGAGGMGEVYKARDTRLDRTIAIKVLPPHTAEQPEVRQRFEREARAVSALNHPHICTLHDVGQ